MTEQTDGVSPEAAEDTDVAALVDGEGQTESASEAEEVVEEAPKPKQTAKDRIDELTKARRQAERDAEYWREQAMKKAEPDAKPAAKTEDEEPDPADFEFGDVDARYLKAVAQHAGRVAARELREADRRETQAQTVEEAYQTRLRAAAEKHEDFEEVVLEGARNKSWPCSPAMAEAIKDSEVGPEVAYHLAKNPTEAKRIYALSPLAQVREIGRLEALVSAPEAPKAKTATEAPEPAPQARGSSGRFKVDPATTDFSAFEKQYVR